MLGSTNPQEVMDLGAVVILLPEGGMPFLHFFDGIRTSHEMQKIEDGIMTNSAKWWDMAAVEQFRARALNPEHPVLRGSAQNPISLSGTRDGEPLLQCPSRCRGKLHEQVNQKIGTDYKLFNYYGAPDAETVLIAMGSVCDAAEEVVDYLTSKGEKVGLIKVRLYRPFATDRFIASIPKTTKSIVVLDRTKDPGAIGEPLYLDVLSALAASTYSGVRTCGGRYGLGSQDTTPAAS